MVLNYREATNGYPVAVLPGLNLQLVRPSQGSGLFDEAQQQYSQFVEGVLSSKKASKKATKFGRRVLTINTGTRLINTLANCLDLEGKDTLYVLEQQFSRVESATKLAERLQVDPQSLVIWEGNFLTNSFSNMMDLMAKRLDVIVFGLGTPSVDRSRKDGTCRVQAELTKSAELLQEGGSLLIAPPLMDTFCVEEALQHNRLQKDPDRDVQRIARMQAIRLIAMK